MRPQKSENRCGAPRKASSQSAVATADQEEEIAPLFFQLAAETIESLCGSG